MKKHLLKIPTCVIHLFNATGLLKHFFKIKRRFLILPNNKFHCLGVIFCIIFLSTKLNAQVQESFKAPEPSKVYEFTKYDQMPVGEYTGIAPISIPLYTVNVDNVNVPLALQYHAGGIHVSDEASFVGLGWNMNFGMISQTVNGFDDLQTYTKRQLKYQDSPLVEQWQLTCNTLAKFPDPITGGMGVCTNCNPEPAFTAGIPKATNSVFIATDYAFPFPNQSYCFSDYNYGTYDMEPDMFRVNFFGHSLRFIKEFTGPNQGQVRVLDNNGYKVEMFTNSDAPNANWNGSVYWKITTPEGDQYFFARQSSSDSYSLSNGDPFASSGSGGHSYTKNWYLVKIVTNKNKTISFDYAEYGNSSSTTYSQSYMNASNFANSYLNDLFPGFYPMVTTQGGTTTFRTTSTCTTTELNLVLTKITTPKEVVNFTYSDRLDRQNDKKLDLIQIQNSLSQVLKQFNFQYDYFTSNATGNVVLLAGQSQSSYVFNDQKLLKRLKLVSVTEAGSNPYTFLYNNIVPLPPKNSTATDYWGYFNGQTSNESLAPNPAALGFPDLGNNGNNKSAYVDYAQAGILTQIDYPTGGYASYDYELNVYTKSQYEMQLTNSDNSTGVIKGAGLRLKSMQLNGISGATARKTNYTYSGGINITPFKLLTHYNTREAAGWPGFVSYTFTIDEFSCSNYIQPSLAGSFNAVGYSQVTAENIFTNNTVNGKTVWTFENVQDHPPLATDTNGFFTFGKMSLPSLTDIDSIENGKLLTEAIYSQGSTLPLTQKAYTYKNLKSAIYYGNKISQFRSLVSQRGFEYEGPPITVSQFLVGYYAIYGKHSLLESVKETEYFDIANIEVTTHNEYNTNDVLTHSYKTTPIAGEIYREDITPSSALVHIQKNILSLPIIKIIYKDARLQEQQNFSYIEKNNITVPSEIDIYPAGNGDQANIRKVYFDQYDDTGNIAEYHDENGMHTCIIWGYNMLLPIAKIDNCSLSQFTAATLNTNSAPGQLQILSNSDNDSCFTGTCNEKNLRDALNTLRSLLPGAMVTTYTYNPGIGLTTQTDPRGNVVFYEFDEYLRLKQVRDANGNLLSKNEYHYKQ